MPSDLFLQAGENLNRNDAALLVNARVRRRSFRKPLVSYIKLGGCDLSR